MRIQEITQRLGGECIGNVALDVTGVAPAEHAQHGQVTFATNRKLLAAAESSGATAVVVDSTVERSSKILIRTNNVLLYTAQLIDLLHPEERPDPGIHPSAVVAASARIGERVRVEAHAVIDENCRIGDHCIIGGGVFVGAHCSIGELSRIHANVSIYPFTRIGRGVIIHSGAVIGADGFRYVAGPGGLRKMRQLGVVQIDDDVEIGANTCIDRASFGITLIEAGVKIDNLVQIGHNCQVGRGSVLVAQCGLSGSVRLGRGVSIAGQAGIADHITLGDHARVGGGSGVHDNIPPGEDWIGYPARPGRQFAQETRVIPRLVKLYKDIRALVEHRTATSVHASGSVRPDAPAS